MNAQTVFDNKIPIPHTVTASWPTVGSSLDLYIRQGVHDFDPARKDSIPASPFNGVTTWYYSTNDSASQDLMHYLGPTLLMEKGEWADITQHNELGPSTPTTIHWHGMELPAGDDGGPHSPIPGTGPATEVGWSLLDPAATFWYHPHLHDETLSQVVMGLSGMIVIADNDPIKNQLPTTYGVDDIPLIIQDQGFTNSTSVPRIINQGKGARPMSVVNGVIRPYYRVPKGMVRLRILNGSSRKALRFAVGPDTVNTNNFFPFYIVADDGGYAMHGADQFTVLTIGPGARTEIVLDLTMAQGADTTVFLRNLASTMGPEFVGGHPGANQGTGNGGGGDVTKGNVLMQLNVNTSVLGAVQTPPTFVRDWASLLLGDNQPIDFARTKYLVHLNVPVGQRDLGYVIADNVPTIADSGLTGRPGFNDCLAYQNLNTFRMGLLNDVICVPSTEEWTIENRSNVSHPFHIHKIFFRITKIDSVADWNNPTVFTTIDVRARGLDAPKDDVLIHPNWRLTWIGTFDDYGSIGTPPADSGMMYHCHILTHEDDLGGGMMHQFAVQRSDIPNSPCTPSVGRPKEDVPVDASVFPVPTENELFLMGASTKPSTVHIYDYTGRLLKEQTLEPFEGTVKLDISGMPRGLLLVEWSSAKGKLAKKVLLR